MNDVYNHERYIKNKYLDQKSRKGWTSQIISHRDKRIEESPNEWSKSGTDKTVTLDKIPSKTQPKPQNHPTPLFRRRYRDNKASMWVY